MSVRASQLEQTIIINDTGQKAASGTSLLISAKPVPDNFRVADKPPRIERIL
jgi:hypothetical protein